MKLSISAVFLLMAVALSTPVPDIVWGSIEPSADGPVARQIAAAQGFDIGYNPEVDWAAVAASGKGFAYILATEGTGNTALPFYDHYEAAHNAGLIRGAYHIARLYSSSGADQAAFFLANGGSWTNDESTLLGALWLEFAPSRASCYGFTAAQTVSWIQDFSDAYLVAAGRRPLLRIHSNYWTTCAANSDAFASTHDLWYVLPGSGTGSPGALPGGWSEWKVWQYQDLGISPTGATLGNLDVFNGDLDAVIDFAT